MTRHETYFILCTNKQEYLKAHIYFAKMQSCKIDSGILSGLGSHKKAPRPQARGAVIARLVQPG